VHAVVVGCGTWGTVFAGLLRGRGHEVELACRDAEQAAAIREARRNPRYATNVDLKGISPAAVADARYEDADVVVLAVPSRVFGEVVRGLPVGAAVLGLTKVSTRPPAGGCRRSWKAAPSRSSPGRTWRRRSPAGYPPPP
jgi:glycerol-3-phosphate dehydrogenase